jgi:chemotaxis family two-component system response regulator PixH
MTKVLMADSAGLFCALQNSFLNRSSCEVITAASVAEAMEKAGEHSPDLILLDADIEGFDSLECCRLMKRDPGLRHAPVLLVGSEVDLRLCEQAGVDALLSKPLAEELLLEAISELSPLSNRRSRRLAAPIEIEYRLNEEQGEAITKDISADGLFLLMSGRPFASGDLLSMAFDLPVEGGRGMALGGEVVRSVEPDPDSHLIPGAGIRFRGLEAPERLKLEAFVGSGGRGEP